MVAGPLLAAVLAAAGPPASRAKELGKQGAWEELYLAFSAGAPDAYSTWDRAAIATELARGCAALERSDAVMAFSLGDRAVVFEASAPAVLCAARAALATEQRGAAEGALRKGLGGHPKNGAIALMLGNLLLDELDHDGAAEVLAKVPRKAPEYGRAQALLKRARQKAGEERDAERQARELEKRLSGEIAPAKGGRGAAGTKVAAARAGDVEAGSGAGPGDMRYRAQGHFVLKYFNNARDFGQRADYEMKVMGALEEAHEASQEILGRARANPVDVVLYTQQEFAAHFSAQTAMRVAGFYMMDSIRINDAAELNRQNRATLVHEYVHAVIDELSGGNASRVPMWVNEGIAEYVEWRYLGTDQPTLGIATALRGLAKRGALPKLRDMDRGRPIDSGSPGLAYATSAVAVRILLSRGGTGAFLDMVAEVARGTPFEQALEARYDRTLEELEGDVREELARR